MAVTFVNSNTGGNSTSVSLTKPSGTADGDYMVTVIASAVAQTITPPAGWNLRGSYTSLEDFLYVYDKTASSEGSSYSWGLSSSSNTCAVAAYRGGTFDAIGSFVNSPSGTSLVLTTVTLSLSGALLAIAGQRATSNNWSNAAGLTERVDFNSSASNGTQDLLIADQLAQAAGASGSITLTAANVKKTGVLLAIKHSTSFVEADMASAGAGSTSQVSGAKKTSPMTSAGVGAAAPTSARVKPTVAASSGVAASAIAAKKLQAGGIAMTGVGSQSLAAAGIHRVSIALTGTGAASSVGARVKLSSISPAGVGATSFAANAYAGTVLNGPGATTMALVGINESFQADLVVAGLSPLSLRGAAIRKVELASSGTGAATFVMNKVWNARMVSAGVGVAGPAGGAFATSAIGTGVVTADGVATSSLKGSAYRQITMSASGLAAGTLRMGKVKTMTTALAGAGTPSMGGAALRQGAMAAPGAGVMALRGAYIQRSQFGFAGFTTSALDGVVFWGNFRRAHDTAMRPAENRLSTRPNEPRETTR